MKNIRLRMCSSAIDASRPMRQFFAVVMAAGAFGNVHATPLTYHGGPVVSHADVFMVNWSNDVSVQISAGMPTFYADILTSDYWQVLQEYSTATQTIRLQGAFAGATTLFVTSCGAASCLFSDSDILAAIGTRINSDDPSLPALSTDGTGNITTVFMVHFGPNDTIKVGTYSSCIDYAAIYETFQADAAHNNLVVPIAIIPDCSAFLPVTHSTSSMLADIVADPQYATNPGWIDATGLSVGDICSSTVTTVFAGGHAYAVPPLWSNSSNACITGVHIFADGFDGP